MINFILVVALIFSIVPLSVNAATFVKNGQDVTAYTASQYTGTGAVRKTANGYAPKVGDVAMRSSANVPFGTIVISSSAVTTGDGYNRNSWSVQDWGVASTQTSHAIDIWWGFCRTNAYTGTNATKLGCSTSDSKHVSAINFGEKSMNLTFYVKE
ncbi:hypothetical protein [Ureibacillus chungkukjangi]|uniref:hypothetical protein n=1 Tax=Ureibacillus chungkukjangi TaxID=1202712 RepID=UPI00203EB607|nr:hypothetical protein [Ureibacillus chungkukjangi]